MAKINFPDPTSTNPWYNPANGITYVHANDTWSAVTVNNTNFDDTDVNVNGDQITGDLTVPSLNGGQLAGFRNVVINGDFRIWQRGTDLLSLGSTTTLNYLADRWTSRPVTQSGGTPTAELFEDDGINKHRFTATGLTSVSYLLQRIEAGNCRHLRGKTVTLSCYASLNL